ncbi:MAG: hypothetical protein ABI972_23210 [Acidobacteriota bacterium]
MPNPILQAGGEINMIRLKSVIFLTFSGILAAQTKLPWQTDWVEFGKALNPVVMSVPIPVNSSDIKDVPAGAFASKEVEWEGVLFDGFISGGIPFFYLDMPPQQMKMDNGVMVPLDTVLAVPRTLPGNWSNSLFGQKIRFRGTTSSTTIASLARTSSGQLFYSVILVNVDVVVATAPTANLTLTSQSKSAGNNGTLPLTAPAGGSVQVTFDGSTSVAGSGTISAYEWRNNGTLIGSTAQFTAALSAASNDITLKVTNSTGLTATASAKVTITVAAPTVTLSAVDPVVNGASFGKNLGWGGWLTIRGTNLARTTRIWAGTDFVNGKLPEAIDGVSVKINGKAAYIYFVSPGQLNILAPDDVAVGATTLEVTAPDGKATTTVIMQMLAPAFFAFDPQGRSYPAAVFADGAYAGPPGLFGSAAVVKAPLPNDPVLLFGNGFGGTTPARPTSDLVLTPAPLTGASSLKLTVGGSQARVDFAGLVSSGLQQFNIVVPQVAPGEQPVVGELNGAKSQDGLFLCVGGAQGQLGVNASSLTFSGAASSSPAPQSIEVTAIGGPIGFVDRASTAAGGEWLSVEPWGQTPQSIRVTVKPTGLAAGTYNGTVTISSCAAAAPQPVTVRLTVQ